jgi:hypothetical protein
MVWGNHPDSLKGLEKSLKKGLRPRAILAINEPNLKGQAYITPEETAATWRRVKRLADRYGIPVIGPHMAIGSAADASITAYDELQKKEVTYTFMIPFLDAFYRHLGKVAAPGIGVHAYGNIGELKWVVSHLFEKYRQPVWVTEFSEWKAPNAEAMMDYLVQAVDFLEHSPRVAGYAWFMARGRDEANFNLLEKSPGRLTPLGELYVNMPVFDPDRHHPCPGRIEIEEYHAAEGPRVERTGDRDGLLNLFWPDAGGWVDVPVDVKRAGSYRIAFRMAGPGPVRLKILAGKRILAELNAPTSGPDRWRTRVETIHLPAGRRILRLSAASGKFRINSLELTAAD